MRFGANYIPSGSWLHCWIDFDENSIRADIQRIREIGCDHIRAHLIWSYFQINPAVLSTTCMKNLKRFVEICEEEEMDFFLSLFTGWMSGFHFIPAWLRGGLTKVNDLTTDPFYIEAERFYIREISKVVGGSRNFLGFDLGNELSCFVADTEEYKDEWAEEMLRVCEECVPGKLHNNGVDDQPWFKDKSFSRPAMVRDGALTPLHCWTEFTKARYHGGTLGTSSLNIAPYMVELAKAYSDDPDRKYWVQEFGISPEWDAESLEDRLTFMRRTFENICCRSDIWGVTWWCSHDIDHRFVGYDSIEYDLGLIDAKNCIKPEGRCYAELIRQYREVQPGQELQTKAITVRPETVESRGWNTAAAYMECVDQGIRPAIILPEKREDREYLARRGITEILD